MCQIGDNEARHACQQGNGFGISLVTEFPEVTGHGHIPTPAQFVAQGMSHMMALTEKTSQDQHHVAGDGID